MSKNSLVLDADFKMSKTHLILDYEVKNQGQRDAYLLNRLYRVTPQWQMNPDIIYVYLEHQSRSVWLKKKIEDIPTDRSVTSPLAPFVTPLRAGRVFSERVRIALPIQEYRQYSLLQARLGITREYVYQRVQFTLGYYWSLDGMTEESKEIEGDSVIVPIAPAGARLEFGELTSRPEKMEISVMENQ